MANRKRDIQLKIWVSPAELEQIKEKQIQAGIFNRGAYIRKMAIDGYVVRVDLSDVKEVIRLMRYCSNNMNQYAKKANETQSIYREDILDIKNRQEEMWNLLRNILERIASIQ